jgi:hypothetical protein
MALLRTKIHAFEPGDSYRDKANKESCLAPYRSLFGQGNDAISCSGRERREMVRQRVGAWVSRWRDTMNVIDIYEKTWRTVSIES